MNPTLRWLLAGLCLTLSSAVHASDDQPARTLFTDVAVFNGTDEKLYEGPERGKMAEILAAAR